MTGVDAMRNGSTIVASSRMMVRESIPMLPNIWQQTAMRLACSENGI